MTTGDIEGAELLDENGNLFDFNGEVLRIAWPTRARLPKPRDDPDPFGRDELYDDHVAGEHLLGPLRVAAAHFSRKGT